MKGGGRMVAEGECQGTISLTWLTAGLHFKINFDL